MHDTLHTSSRNSGMRRMEYHPTVCICCDTRSVGRGEATWFPCCLRPGLFSGSSEARRCTPEALEVLQYMSALIFRSLHRLSFFLIQKSRTVSGPTQLSPFLLIQRYTYHTHPRCHFRTYQQCHQLLPCPICIFFRY